MPQSGVFKWFFLIKCLCREQTITGRESEYMNTRLQRACLHKYEEYGKLTNAYKFHFCLKASGVGNACTIVYLLIGRQ